MRSAGGTGEAVGTLAQPPVVGLIAGGGELPRAFVKQAARRGLAVVVVEIQAGRPNGARRRGTGGGCLRARAGVQVTYRLDLSQWEELVNVFTRHGVKDVYVAGKVNRMGAAAAAEQASAGEARGLLQAGRHLGDQTLSQLFADSLARHGLRLGEQREILGALLAPAGVLTRREPTPQEQADAGRALDLARGVAKLEIGQTVVVKDGTVLAVEAAVEGTDATIRRAGRLGGPGAVVAKVGGPTQDLRLDTPVVGPRTIRAMASAGASCLALEAGRCFILHQDAVVRAADGAGICIVAR